MVIFKYYKLDDGVNKIHTKWLQIKAIDESKGSMSINRGLTKKY